MAKTGYYGLRITDDREAIIERLRQRLAISGRKVEMIHGTVTTSGILDEALKALDKELDKEEKRHRG